MHYNYIGRKTELVDTAQHMTQHKRFVLFWHSPKFLLRKNFFYTVAVRRNFARQVWEGFE